jgi:single-strand DNA-binding protein
MRSVNNVTLLGNLASDPELRYTKSGRAVINFSIATNYSYKKDDEWVEVTSYHKIVFWGKTAELISQLSKKGSRVYVSGRLQTRSWEGEDGKKNYITEIIGEEFISLTPKEKTEKVSEETTQAAEEVFDTEEDDVEVDDIPF